MITQDLYGMDAPAEFIGATVLDTIGLVIADVDADLHDQLGIPQEFHSVGLISSRSGAAGQIVAVDDAIKTTNAKIVSIELPRDSKGYGGHGNYIVVGADNVEDCKRAVKFSLDLIEKYANELYTNEAGHLEFAYSARASEAIAKVFDCPKGKAFGFMAGSPAAIGMVMADRAVKAASVDIIKSMTPNRGSSLTNEVILAFCGDAQDVKESVMAARAVGKSLLELMGGEVKSLGEGYIN